MRNYTFKCIRKDGPGPAVHMDTCTDDADARQRALSLFHIWPLAVKVEVLRGDRQFEVTRLDQRDAASPAADRLVDPLRMQLRLCCADPVLPFGVEWPVSLRVTLPAVPAAAVDAFYIV